MNAKEFLQKYRMGQKVFSNVVLVGAGLQAIFTRLTLAMPL
jgi:hypothetical protein